MADHNYNPLTHRPYWHRQRLSHPPLNETYSSSNHSMYTSDATPTCRYENTTTNFSQANHDVQPFDLGAIALYSNTPEQDLLPILPNYQDILPTCHSGINHDPMPSPPYNLRSCQYAQLTTDLVDTTSSTGDSILPNLKLPSLTDSNTFSSISLSPNYNTDTNVSSNNNKSTNETNLEHDEQLLTKDKKIQPPLDMSEVIETLATLKHSGRMKNSDTDDDEDGGEQKGKWFSLIYFYVKENKRYNLANFGKIKAVFGLGLLFFPKAW